MSDRLPRLRDGLDMMPSPLRDHPGLLIRDPMRFTDATVIVPPQLVPLLAFFDGERSVLDVKVWLTRRSGGKLGLSEVVDRLVTTLEQGGFLESERFLALRAERLEGFRRADERTAVHAGSAYPAGREQLQATLAQWLAGRDGEDVVAVAGERTATANDRVAAAADGAPVAGGGGPVVDDRAAAAGGGDLVAIAAPHVSPHGGIGCYRAAYRALGPRSNDRAVIVLGTSHYGAPERFGLTRKRFVTPLGEVDVDTALVDELAAAAPEAVIEEDYCHAVEHSIEFQVVFLQQVLEPPFRVVPLLCGPFVDSLTSGRRPEATESTRRFFGALAEIAAREGDRLLWILGIDLAHVGARYGDSNAVVAGQGRMAEVAEFDRRRLDHALDLEIAGFFDLVHPGGDDLRWCGYPPLYTFLAVMGAARPRVRGKLLRYEQWNIDPRSVVSFAALSFHDS